MRKNTWMTAVLTVTTAAGLTLGSPASANPASTTAIDVPAGSSYSYLVFDRDTNTIVSEAGAHERYRSASVVKILIALDYLESLAPDTQVPTDIPAEDLALLEPMLRASNDDAASILWVRDGWEAIIARMVAKIGMTDTAPPPADRRGWWGYTALSAADVVTMYQYILTTAHPQHRDFIMDNLRHSAPCGDDGFDQSFGIPSAAPRPWAVKQGWSAFRDTPQPGEACGVPYPLTPLSQRILDSPEAQLARLLAPGEDADIAGYSAINGSELDLNRRLMHTTGTLGERDEKIIAVLTLHPADTPWQVSAARITDLTKTLYRLSATPAEDRPTG